MDEIYDVIIIGSGPAGLTAGLYTSRNRLRTLIIERETIGGKLPNRELIENYPSYPNGISGPELAAKMVDQMTRYKVKIRLDEVEKIIIDVDYKTIKTSCGELMSKTIIVAGGATNKKLNIPGVQQFEEKGMFYCATCDGPTYINKVVAIIGGGDSGFSEALSLARYTSKIVIIEVLDHCTATKILKERVASNPKIEVRCNQRIESFKGGDHLTGIELMDTNTKNVTILEVDGILAQIGLEPNTQYLINSLALDNNGYLVVNDKMSTNIPGIFAAGDIRNNSEMQIATAVGDGATAAINAARYLSCR